MNKADQAEMVVLEQAAHSWLCNVTTGATEPWLQRIEAQDATQYEPQMDTVVETQLRMLAGIRLGLDKLEWEAVREARVDGFSWEQIGAAMFREPDELKQKYSSDSI
ncbi:hypothetical protein [Microbacterium gorillae]|uniref:hypothetical protein n=1 Tax=Microbacterium gorillae TaxID=1231063 RepID=UPI003D955102